MENLRKFICYIKNGSLIILLSVIFYITFNTLLIFNEANIKEVLKKIQSILLLSFFCSQMVYYYVCHKIDSYEKSENTSDLHEKFKELRNNLKIIAMVYGFMFFLFFVAEILILRN